MKHDSTHRALEIVRAGYDKIADIYTKDRETFDNWSELQEFCSRLPANARVLDVGCGTGIPVAKYLIANGIEVVGIDLSKEMISVAGKNVPEAEFIQMNMTELGFRERSFDAVLSCYAIFHVPREKHAAIFRSFDSVLMPQGTMLISVGATEWEEVEDYYGVDMFWSHYEPAKSESLITDAGFKIEFGRTVETGGERHHWVLATKHKGDRSTGMGDRETE